MNIIEKTVRQLHMIRERGGMVGFNVATFYTPEKIAIDEAGQSWTLRAGDGQILGRLSAPNND